MKRFALIPILALCGCVSTHYAKIPTATEASPDSSTPGHYQVNGTGDFTSGYLGKVNIDGTLYNAMTQGWHRDHPKVAAKAFTDTYGNPLWAVSDEALLDYYKSTLNP